MYCLKCGTQLPENASFCSQCGTPQGAQPPQPQAFPPQPGAYPPPQPQAFPPPPGAYPPPQPQAFPPPPGAYPPPGSPYAPPQAQAMPSYASPRDIPTYMVQAVLVTIFCCIPLGVVAIVNASNVGTAIARQDWAAAEKASSNAKLFCWLALGGGLVAGILGVLAGLLGG